MVSRNLTRILSSIFLFLLVSGQPFASEMPFKRKQQLKVLLPSQRKLANIVPAREPEFYTKSGLSLYVKVPQTREFLLEYGFTGLVVMSYFVSGEIITLEIYKMKNYKGAFGMFKTIKIADKGDFKLGGGSIRNDSTIIFWQGAYLVKLISLGRSGKVIEAMKKVATMISQRIGYNKKIPYPVRILPAENQVRDSLKFVMGPIGFKKYFSFLPKGIFDSEKDINEAAIAQYKGKVEFSWSLLRLNSNYRSASVLSKIVKKLKENSIDHYYLFDVLFYRLGDYYFKIDRIENYISIIKYANRQFRYDFYLDKVRKKITGYS